MDKIEQAREIFRNLENGDTGKFADIARREFFIRDRLAGIN